MIEFGTSVYYLDLKALDKAITISDGNKSITERESKRTTTSGAISGNTPVVTTEEYERIAPRIKEIDPVKYDLLKTCIEYIIDSEEVSDDSLGADRALSEASFGYKLVFNTLYKEGIIKEKE